MANSPVDETPTSPAWVSRYLALLGIEHPAPSLEALSQLTRAHLAAVPFENVSSILRRRAQPEGPVPPLDLEAVLAGWEQRRGGGVCFEVAGMLGPLLVGLGYRAHPVVASTWRMSFLGAHQAVLVELEGKRYLVDAGNGAPFFEPIPLDGPVEVRGVGLAYRFRPDDEAESWTQDRWIDGAWAPFCRYDLRPPNPAPRAAAYQRHHTPGESWVVDKLTLIRCEAEAVYVLRDGQLTHFTAAGKRTEPVTGAAAHARLAAEIFKLPALPIAEALAALAEPSASWPA